MTKYYLFDYVSKTVGQFHTIAIFRPSSNIIIKVKGTEASAIHLHLNFHSVDVGFIHAVYRESSQNHQKFFPDNHFMINDYIHMLLSFVITDNTSTISPG